MVDFSLSEEQKALQSLAREFARKEIIQAMEKITIDYKID